MNGGIGFEGINPCGQTHGSEKLYPVGETPTSILLSGNYTKVKTSYSYFKCLSTTCFEIVNFFCEGTSEPVNCCLKLNLSFLRHKDISDTITILCIKYLAVAIL